MEADSTSEEMPRYPPDITPSQEEHYCDTRQDGVCLDTTIENTPDLDPVEDNPSNVDLPVSDTIGPAITTETNSSTTSTSFEEAPETSTTDSKSSSILKQPSGIDETVLESVSGNVDLPVSDTIGPVATTETNSSMTSMLTSCEEAPETSTTDSKSSSILEPPSSIDETVLESVTGNVDLPVSDTIGPVATTETNSSTTSVFTGNEETSEISTPDSKSSSILQQRLSIDESVSESVTGNVDLPVSEVIAPVITTETNSSTTCLFTGSEEASQNSASESKNSLILQQPSSTIDKTVSKSVAGNDENISSKAESSDNQDLPNCLQNDIPAKASEVSDPPNTTATQELKVPENAADDVLDSSNCLLEDNSCLSDAVDPNLTPTTLLEATAGYEEKASVSSATTKKESKPTADASETQEDKNLYSEIVATTTRVKILQKYFGDPRRPGICHKPHHKSNYGSFKCRECQQSFSYLPSLLLHGNKHGKKHFVYECSKCSYRSLVPGAYTQHEFTSHKNHLYRCYICDVTFLQRSTLNRHKAGTGVSKLSARRVRRLKPRFVCKLCNVILRNRSALTTHLQEKHMDAFPKDSNKCVNSDTACNNDAFVDGPARDHSQRHIEMPNKHVGELQHNLQTVGGTQKKCRWCSFTNSSTDVLTVHEKQRHFICLSCYQNYSDAESLKEHMQRVHQVGGNEGSNKDLEPSNQTSKQLHIEFQCPTCKITFLSFSNLEAHLKTHSEVKNPAGSNTDTVKHWYCVTCNVIFPCKKSLDLHVILNHTENQEWRCLLCNTLYQSLLECKKHQAMHHPDEYRCCHRSDIARPVEPSKLPKSGSRSSYTCNMCDGKCSSLEDLHRHKAKFHKIAYNISINDKQYSTKRLFKCRYRCGFTNIACKAVNKHEANCTLKRSNKFTIYIKGPIVLDPATGKLVRRTSSHLTPDESLKTDQQENPDQVKESSCSDKADQPTTSGISKAETMNPHELVKPKQQPVITPGAPTSVIPSHTVEAITTSSRVTRQSSPAITQSSASTSTGTAQFVRLPIYSKHDRVSSSSDNESDCSWFDKSSSSDKADADVDSASIYSDDHEDEKERGTNNSENKTVTALSGDEGREGQNEDKVEHQDEPPRATPQSQAKVQETQLPQSKPAAAPSNSCPPLLQPSVLIRFFQAIDMSDLYRLALQMITGSPQPHALPTSDPAMVPSKMAHFKYKIPFGYSHKDFQEMPLFPSSEEAMRVHNMETLPTSLLRKYYKGILPKPGLRFLSTMVDSAVINQFHDTTLKMIERNVRKQRADDRKDITLRLSKYIVSQYAKNQQKKGPSVQSTSLLGIGPTIPGNSAGAGPSSVKRHPSTIQLYITPTAEQGSSFPVVTVKRAVLLSQTANTISCLAQNNSQGAVTTNVPVIYKVISPTSTSAASTHTVMTTTSSTLVQEKSEDHAKSEGEKPNEKTPAPQIKRIDEPKSCSEAEKTKKEAKPTKRKIPLPYSVPVRRSARLLQSPEKESSSLSTDNDNGFAGSFTSDIQIVKQNLSTSSDCSDSSSGEKAPKRTKYDSQNGASDCDNRNQDCQDGDELKHKPNSNHCKDSELHCTQDNESDANSPESTSKLAERFQITSLSSAGATCQSVSQSSNSDTVQQVPITELHAGNVPDKYDIRLHIPKISSTVLHDEMLVNTIERDGVIQMRLPRRPLHGLNVYENTMQRQTDSETCVTRQPINVQVPVSLTKNSWKKTVSKFEVFSHMVNTKYWRRIQYKLPELNTGQTENKSTEESAVSPTISNSAEVDSFNEDNNNASSVCIPHQASEKSSDLDLETLPENHKTDAVNIFEEDTLSTKSLAVTQPAIELCRASTDHSSEENAKTQQEHESDLCCFDRDDLTHSKISPDPEQTSRKTLESLPDTEPDKSEVTSCEVEQSSENIDTDKTQDSTKLEPVRTSVEDRFTSQNNVSQIQEEMGTQRMLRSSILKRRESSTSEIKKKKQKTAVDHSHMETSELKSSGRSPQSAQPVTCQSFKAVKSRRKLDVPQSRQHRGSSRVINDDVSDDQNPTSEQEALVKSAPREYDASSADHSPSNCNDQSNSTAFTAQIQDQLAAMGRCYVRLTPIDLACHLRDGENVELLSSGKWASSQEILETRKAPKGDNESTPGRRQLRPRGVDSSHFVT